MECGAADATTFADDAAAATLQLFRSLRLAGFNRNNDKTNLTNAETIQHFHDIFEVLKILQKLS